MEGQLLQLLADTHSTADAPRKAAEQHLAAAASDPAFPGTLAAIASHASVSGEIRQSALTVLRGFVERNWSGEVDADDGEVGSGPAIAISEEVKGALRGTILELATSGEADRRIRSLAR